MIDPVLYTEALIEYTEDGFRWKISEVDGIFKFEYQEYVDKDGGLYHDDKPGKGEWKTKSEMEGMWCSDVDKICKALKLVAAQSEC